MTDQIFAPSFIDDVQESNMCTKCNHEFRIGDSIINHYIKNHIEFIFNLLSAGEKSLCLQHDKTPDKHHLEREQNKGKGFIPPKCKKCKHDEPDYIVVSSIPHTDGIKLKCNHCGDISIKD